MTTGFGHLALTVSIYGTHPQNKAHVLGLFQAPGFPRYLEPDQLGVPCSIRAT